MRYIEANPLRAGLVDDLAAYPWSSYGVHGLGHPHPLVSEAPVPLPIRGGPERQRQYGRQWLHTPLTEAEVAAVRRSVANGRPFGSAAWTERMAEQLKLRPARPRGRPRKAEK